VWAYFYFFELFFEPEGVGGGFFVLHVDEISDDGEEEG